MTLRFPTWLPEALLLFTVVFGPLSFGAVEPWSLAVLEILLFSALALVILRGPIGEGRSLRNPVFWAVVTITMLGLLQRLNPRPLVQPTAILPFTVAAHRSGPAVVLWFSYGALLWYAPQTLGTRPAVRRLAWAVFLLGAVVAVVGIAQSGQGNNAYYGLRPIRRGDPFGPYTNRDHAASLMVMSLFVGAGIFFAHLDRLRRQVGVGRLAEMSALLAMIAFFLIVIGFGTWKTHSRGAIGSFCATAWAMGMLCSGRIVTSRMRNAARGLLACVAAGYVLFLYFHPDWVGSVFSAPDSSTAYRLSMYRSSLRIIRDFPIFGIGLGATQSIFPAYQESLVQGIVEHVHSDWLELASNVGLPGTVLYAGTLLFFLRRMKRHWLNCPSRELLFLSAGVLAAVFAFMLHGIVDFSFHIPANAVVFMALLTLLEGLLRAAQLPEAAGGEQDIQPQPRTRRRMSLAITPLGLMGVALRPAVASWYRFQADASPPPAQVGLLAKAATWRADPDFAHETAFSLFLQAQKSPPQRRVGLLRDALIFAGSAREAEPYNPRFRQLMGTLLWHLGRRVDAGRLLETVSGGVNP